MKTPHPRRFVLADGRPFSDRTKFIEPGRLFYKEGGSRSSNVWTLDKCLERVEKGQWKELPDMKAHREDWRIERCIVIVGHRWKSNGSRPAWQILFQPRNAGTESTRWRKELSLAITEAENKWKSEMPWESAVALMKPREQGCKMLPGWREALHYH